MATSILNTGEAFLSANEKRFARIGAPAPIIHRDRAVEASPILTSAVLLLAIVCVAVAALIG